MAKRTSKADKAIAAIVLAPIIFIGAAIYSLISVLSRAIVKSKINKEVQSLTREREELLAIRANGLREKYPDPLIANRIIDKTIWIGQSKEMLVDSIGEPAAIDKKYSSKKRLEVWKYHPLSKRSFKLRVDLEDDLVKSFDYKE